MKKSKMNNMDIYDRALKLLSIREHTAFELRNKLLDRGFFSDDIDVALESLKTKGLLSDKRFAESYIHSRLMKNPEGKLVLLSRLKERGCDREVSIECIDAFWQDEEWLKSLSKAIGKKIGKKSADDTIAYYRRKGFSPSEIKRAMQLIDLEYNGIE